jgi:enamine deaminase RidA (YjgF/YER057c/UK114 family)
MSKQRTTIVQPEGWAPPRGYANGMIASGRSLWVAGQIGWDAACNMVSDDFVAQFGQALANVVAVVRAAGGEPSDIVRLTIYATDLDAYRNSAREIGAAYRESMGKHFPAMALVGVAGLVHPQAKVEIEATAMLEES